MSYGRAPTVNVIKGSTPEYHLRYLALRGLGDIPALILEASGADYEATYYGKQEFADVKKTLPFGRLPVLSSPAHLHGVTLAQSDAIVRHLATTFGLAGSTPVERAQVDMWYETYKELFKEHSRWGKSFSVDALFEAGNSVDGVLTFKESNNGGEYSAFETSYLALMTFEASVKESGWVGGMPHKSFVDLALFRTLHDLTLHTPSWSSQLRLPALQRLYHTVLAIEEVASYLASDRRMPRVEVRTEPTRDYWYVEDSPAPVPLKGEL